jgi:hypothetical protein
MEISFIQNIYYSNKEKIPISEVAKSLLALEELSRVAPEILEKLYEDVTVRNMSVYVDELASGSLKEKINFYFWVAFQKFLAEESGLEPKQLEEESPERRNDILAWVMVAILVIALKAAADKVFPNSEKENIAQQINITFNAGRDITGIDTEKLRKTVEGVVENNPQVVKGAVGFVKPAKKEKEAYIEIDRNSRLSSSFLNEIPDGMIEEGEQEKVIELANTVVFIRATDKDSGKRGWGATILEFNERRIRMHVAPGIDLKFLAHQDVVIGDVAIFFSVDKEGNIRKPHAHLYSIDKDATLRYK